MATQKSAVLKIYYSPPPFKISFNCFFKCLFEYIFCITAGTSCLPYLICAISFSDWDYRSHVSSFTVTQKMHLKLFWVICVKCYNNAEMSVLKAVEYISCLVHTCQN